MWTEDEEHRAMTQAYSVYDQMKEGWDPLLLAYCFGEVGISHVSLDNSDEGRKILAKLENKINGEVVDAVRAMTFCHKIRVTSSTPVDALEVTAAVALHELASLKGSTVSLLTLRNRIRELLGSENN